MYLAVRKAYNWVLIPPFMQLYHGSPLNLDVLEPQQGKGVDSFEDLHAVFLTKTFLHAALYALGKGLKGKTSFAVSPTKLAIVGDFALQSGYVYTVDVADPVVGPREQYASLTSLTPVSQEVVLPKDYMQNVVRVSSQRELFAALQ